MGELNRLYRTFRLESGLLVLFFVAITAPAQAAELTSTERALLERIEALEKRIEELEGRVPTEANEPAPAKPPTETLPEPDQPPAEDLTLAERVKKLEAAASESPEPSLRSKPSVGTFQRLRNSPAASSPASALPSPRTRLPSRRSRISARRLWLGWLVCFRISRMGGLAMPTRRRVPGGSASVAVAAPSRTRTPRAARTSLTNHIPGRIARITHTAVRVLVEIDCGLVVPVLAEVTERAVRRLELEPGTELVAMCKAQAIRTRALERPAVKTA